MSTSRPARASIVSGYFNPLHDGHLDLFEAARAEADHLIVIVNNDQQQLLKKGRIIQPEQSRVRIVEALRSVDRVYLAVDDGPGIERTFDVVRADYPDTDLVFCNGGDRDMSTLPEAEIASAKRNAITALYGVGGVDKVDSSTRIVAALEDEAGEPVRGS